MMHTNKARERPDHRHLPPRCGQGLRRDSSRGNSVRRGPLRGSEPCEERGRGRASGARARAGPLRGSRRAGGDVRAGSRGRRRPRAAKGLRRTRVDKGGRRAAAARAATRRRRLARCAGCGRMRAASTAANGDRAATAARRAGLSAPGGWPAAPRPRNTEKTGRCGPGQASGILPHADKIEHGRVS
jgi:hypothetical protein